jgi:hypothetical protein
MTAFPGVLIVKTQDAAYFLHWQVINEFIYEDYSRPHLFGSSKRSSPNGRIAYWIEA